MKPYPEVTKHFDNVAGTYKSNYCGNSIVTHSFNARLKIVLSFLQDVSGKVILDIGCGPGILASYLKETSCCEFYGIDISKEMINECSRNSRLRGFYFEAIDPVEFFHKDRNKKFDYITCMGLFEYLSDEYTKELMGLISEHLHLGGKLIATYPNKYSPYRLADRIYGKLSGKEIMVPPFTPGVKHKEYSERKLKKEWSAKGIEINRVGYYNFRLIAKPLDTILPALDLYISRKLQFLSESCLRYLATAMVLRGCKK